MTDILQQIVDNKRREVEAMAAIDRGVTFSSSHPRATVSMKHALSVSPSGIIAEFKRRSPSKGEIHPKAIVSDVVTGYEKAGASACSILTDTPFFGGALTDLAVARSCVELPLMRKEFIVSEYQIEEARRYGADAVLLIASVLDRETISRFTTLAHSLDLEVLLELHTMEELDRFCPDADMVGINNRNLKTFHTDPMLSMKMVRELPSDIVKIAESGLTSMAEVMRLRDAGYRGFLIGETFMRSSDPGRALAEFINDK